MRSEREAPVGFPAKQSVFSGAASAALFFALATLSMGCGAAATKCVQTPASSKVPEESLAVCEDALTANLDRMDVFQAHMGLLRARGRFSEIVRWSRRVLARDAARTDAIYNLSFGLRKEGKCSEALRHYKRYAELNQDDPDPYFGMALCHEDAGDSAAALDAYGVYVKMEQRPSQRAWIERAQARVAALRGVAGAGAVVAGAPAATGDSGAGGGLLPSARVQTGAGPDGSAPGPTKVVATGGGVETGGMPAAGATPAAGRAGAPESSQPAGRAPAARAAAAQGSAPAGAAKDCLPLEKAVAADPFNVAAYDLLAECALAAGRHSDVVRRMRTAIRDNPDYTRGYYHLGRAYRSLGDGAQAKSAFEKACAGAVAEACGQ